MTSGSDKGSKRSRLGNRVQRGVYRSAHAYKHPWYGDLCHRADVLNQRGSADDIKKQEARLDVKAQVIINRERAAPLKPLPSAGGEK